MTRGSIAFGCAMAAALASGTAEAGTLWVAPLSHANEVPPSGVPYTGTGILVLNDVETSASVTTSHNIPANLLTDGHVHRGPAGVNGPAILPFRPFLTANPIGPVPWAIPAAEVVNLKNGRLYVNLHTSVHPAGAIRGQLQRFLLATSAVTPGQIAVANALDVSAGGNPDLDQVLFASVAATPDGRARILGDISAGTAHAETSQAVEAMTQTQARLFDEAEGVAGEDGVRLFANAAQDSGERESHTDQAGSKVSRTAFLAGFSASPAPGARIGAALAYSDGSDKFRAGLGRTDAKVTSVLAFASAGLASFTVTGVAGYGWTEYDTDRNLSSLGRSASSSHDGKVWSVGARVAAPMDLGGGTVSPYAQIDAQRVTVDAYSEAGAGAVGLTMPKRKDTAAAAELGAVVAMPLQAGDGLGVRLQAGWRRQLDKGGDAFGAALQGSPTEFTVTTVSPDKNAAHLSAMLTGVVGGRVQVAAGYRGILGARSTLHSGEVRLSLPF